MLHVSESARPQKYFVVVMTDRRKRPANRFGCKPTEDVCVEHDEPLVCRHGCENVKLHKCADAFRVVEPMSEVVALISFAATVMRCHRGSTSNAVLRAFERLSPDLQRRIGAVK